MAFVASVHAKAIALIKLALAMTTAAGSGHPTSAASLAHLITLLMYNYMRYNPAHPNQAMADRLVLSEGGRTPEDMLRSLHLSASDIVQTAIRMLDVAAR